MNIYVYAEAANSNVSYIDDTSNNGVNLPVYVDSSNNQLPIIVRVVKSNNDVAYILTTTATSSTNALLKIEGVSRYYQPVLYTVDAKVYIDADSEETLLDVLNNANYIELTTYYIYDA